MELNFIICTNGFLTVGSDSDIQIPFLGQISLFAGNFAPAGWAFCQGQLLNAASNTALFSIMGTAYGGNYPSNFNLPDLRGYRAVDIEFKRGRRLGMLAQESARRR